jgi:hypothetical protein
LFRIRGKNQLGEVCRHLGQQRKVSLGMGSKGTADVGPWERRGSLLGIEVRFRLPTKANFNKLMISLKDKMIAWGNCNLSLAGRILIANQVLLSSMWYMAALLKP